MRTAIVFNFLIESSIIASIGILLMLLARRFFRGALGSRAILFGWVLVGIRLLCPLVLPNPLINEIRPPAVRDWGIRPIAAQVKVRLRDLTRDLYYALDADSRVARWVGELVSAQYSARLSWALFGLWVAGAVCAAAWFVVRWARHKGEWKKEFLPALCCAIHWFNPLVWLAWRMLRSDAVLCRSEPRVRRPLGIGFAVLASVLLVCAFATGEYTAPLATPEVLSARAEALPRDAEDEAVLAYIKALCRQPGFEVNMDDASWELRRHACGYEAYGELDNRVCRVNLLPDGRLVHWETLLEDPRYEGFGIAYRAPDDLCEELAQYALKLTDQIHPGVSDWIEAFENGQRTERYDKSVIASIEGVTYIYRGEKHPGLRLVCQVEPEVRVLSYSLEPPVLQRMWDTQLEPMPSSLTETLLGMPAACDRGETYGETQRAAGLLTAEDAFEKALSHIRANYGETDRSLRRFEAYYGLFEKPDRWYFHLRSVGFGGLYLDGYEMEVDAKTGAVLSCFGMSEGNG